MKKLFIYFNHTLENYYIFIETIFSLIEISLNSSILSISDQRKFDLNSYHIEQTAKKPNKLKSLFSSFTYISTNSLSHNFHSTFQKHHLIRVGVTLNTILVRLSCRSCSLETAFWGHMITTFYQHYYQRVFVYYLYIAFTYVTHS